MKEGAAKLGDTADPFRLAAFVSPHGFGHAARSSAVIEAIAARRPTEVELFTTAPEWFFGESIAGLYHYHETVVDVGFRQRSALEYDVAATITALRELVPFEQHAVRRCADRVRDAECRVVLCDIAPFGVAVAEAAGLPSLVVENFSWDWLYAPLHSRSAELAHLGGTLDEWMDRATVRVQARPVCERRAPNELVDPIARRPRLERARAREALAPDPASSPVVVVTMGGYGEDLPWLDSLSEVREATFVVTGVPETGVRGNLRLFDNSTPLFMPDVLRAADAVVAKLGYGTVSEVWGEGLPFAYVTRPDFREMRSLEVFAEEELSGFLVDSEAFRSGTWIERIDELLAMPRLPHSGGGADRVAEIVLGLAGL